MERSVVAVSRGYYGLQIREVGDRFAIPADEWDDKKRRPSWVKLDVAHAFGGKGDHDGDGSVGGSKPQTETAPFVVPADWQSLSAGKRKHLAKEIDAAFTGNVDAADKVIGAYAEAHKPAPFSDAPAPEVVQPAGNGVQDALGGPQPDWLAPGVGETGDPKPVDD